MNLLILGGTVFLGRSLVDAAQARGHRVTLFNRGRSNPGVFPDLETIHGDRSSDLDKLHGRRWDAVIDTCGYVPRIVRASARALAGSAGSYTFISSLSVYADTSIPADESSPVGKLEDETVETVDGGTYGPLKALCEQAVQAEFAGRALILRPGLIVGPYDPSDRFTYWPHRIAQGGEVLAPGRPERRIQFIDARDLAEWTIRMLENGKGGVFNADSPPGMHTLGGLLETCKRVANSDARLTWVSESFLHEEGVEMWSELPVWVPESDAEYAGFFEIAVNKALEQGLSFRPLADTVRDTLAWDAARPSETKLRAGLSRAREAELLTKVQGIG